MTNGRIQQLYLERNTPRNIMEAKSYFKFLIKNERFPYHNHNGYIYDSTLFMLKTIVCCFE